MINDKTTLDCVPISQEAKVIDLTSTGAMRRRMLDLGLIKGTNIKPIQKSPAGDPTAYYIRGAVIALRKEDAFKIIVEY